MKLRLASLVLMSAFPATLSAQVLDVRELNTEQIRALDRAKTAVILTGGILEQHGPYLPAYTDGYWNERLSRDLAEAIAARPGWTALVFPAIPLGEGGANMIGGKHSFPGSFNVSGPTLRGVFMDLGDTLGEQGFRWIFIVDGHGSPLHNRSLDEAGDYFHDTHGGRMVHLYGLEAVRNCCDRSALQGLSEAERAENGSTVHAGASEHSTILFLRPDLVAPGYRSARSWTGKDFPDLVRMARADDWPGYFGAPRVATAALGAQLHREESQQVIATAVRILDGWDPSGEPRYADAMFAATPVAVEAVNPAIKEEERRLARQRDWLARKKARP
jgi:creatinine amidohydrolase/Fe(II)-dependent formamide hydrolase-like protein